MTATFLRRTTMLSSMLVLAGIGTAFVSCASTEPAPVHAEDASTTLGSQDAGDATIDAPVPVPDAGACDAADPGCVAKPISCDEATWCPVPAPIPPESALTAVWGWSEHDVLAVGSAGVVLRWDGVAWASTPSPAGKNTFYAVWGTGAADIWLASGTDALFHATKLANGVPEWVAEPNLTGDPFNTASLLAIWGSGGGDVRLGGGRFMLDTHDGFVDGNQFVRSAPAEPWTGLAGSGTVRGIWGSSATDVWLIVDNSENSPSEKGATFHGTGKDLTSLTWKAVDSQTGVGLNAIWGSSGDDVWAVGEAGTIRHVSSTSARWSPVASPTKAHLRAIWGSGPNDVWAVGQAGTILHWDGVAWTESVAAFPAGSKPDLFGVWGSGADDVWIVGDGIILRSTSNKGKSGLIRSGP